MPLDTQLDFLGGGLIINMRCLISIFEHLKPSGFISQPVGFECPLHGFPWRSSLNTFCCQKALKCLPKEFNDEFKALNSSVHGQAIGFRFLKGLPKSFQRCPEIAQALALFLFSHKGPYLQLRFFSLVPPRLLPTSPHRCGATYQTLLA